MTAGLPSLPVLHGLVLAGGSSTRMGQDKAWLEFGGGPQLRVVFELLGQQVEHRFVSVRAEHREEPLRAEFPQIIDRFEGIGSAAGLLAAHAQHPDAAWLVLACDLPLLRAQILAALIQARDVRHDAVAYANGNGDAIEPLCAIWEPAALAQLAQQVADGRNGLVSALRDVRTHWLPTPADGALDNINTPQERARLSARNKTI